MLGADGYGELGDDGSESASDVPVAVKGLAGVASLEVGTGSACGVMKNGGAECWGYVAGTVPADLAGIGPIGRRHAAAGHAPAPRGRGRARSRGGTMA